MMMTEALGGRKECDHLSLVVVEETTLSGKAKRQPISVSPHKFSG